MTGPVGQTPAAATSNVLSNRVPPLAATLDGGRHQSGDVPPNARAGRTAAAFLLSFPNLKTQRAYRGDLSSFFRWCAAHQDDARRPLDPLQSRRTHLDIYFRQLAEMPTPEGRRRAPSSVRRAQACLSSFFAFALDEDVIDRSPASRVRRPGGTPAQPPAGLTFEELAALLEAAERHNTRSACLLTLLALNGLRLDEALSRDIEHLDVDGGRRVLWLHRKGGDSDRAPLAAETAATLDRYVGDRTAGPLLVTRTGRRLDPSNVRRLLRRLARDAAIAAPDRVHPHLLRHTWVTLALAEGAEITDVQDGAGHADPRTTQGYNSGRHRLDRHPTYLIAARLRRDVPPPPRRLNVPYKWLPYAYECIETRSRRRYAGGMRTRDSRQVARSDRRQVRSYPQGPLSRSPVHARPLAVMAAAFISIAAVVPLIADQQAVVGAAHTSATPSPALRMAMSYPTATPEGAMHTPSGSSPTTDTAGPTQKSMDCSSATPGRRAAHTPGGPTSGGPTSAPAPTASPRAGGDAHAPGDVIDLAGWYLTLPTGEPGRPDTVENPTLAAYSSSAFRLGADRKSVVFTADAGGVTTKNSDYPRAELREMDGSKKAAWTNTTGSHVLEVCEAVTKVPPVKPEVVAAQIHDAHNDVLEIRLEGKRLTAQSHGGKDVAELDPAYRLGTPYLLKLVAADSHVQVFYDGAQKADLALRGDGWYFKTGSYVQSNEAHGEAPDAAGEVAISSLAVHHSTGIGSSNRPSSLFPRD